MLDHSGGGPLPQEPSVPPGAHTSHESILSVRGRRSGLAINVAVHSTRLGPALGGARLWHYSDWQLGLADAMRLSAAMSLKCAAAGLPTGGGKSVICLEPGRVLQPEERRDAMLDLGDTVHMLGGTYRTAEDVGTSTGDMAVVRERTPHVLGLGADAGGAGDPSIPTARGVLASIRAVLRARTGSSSARERVVTVSGLGHVGSLVARSLAAEGARLVVTDVNSDKRVIAEELGARWVPPGRELVEPCDLFVPAGVGGVLTKDVIANLDTSMIAGPANNQLAYSSADGDLAERDILWVPDFIANAGGAIHAILADAERRPRDEVADRVEAIEETVADVLQTAEATGSTPLRVAIALADARLARPDDTTVTNQEARDVHVTR